MRLKSLPVKHNNHLIAKRGGSLFFFFFQNDVTSFENRNDILTLLIHLGYLSYDALKKTARIPNLEIRKEFIDTLAMSLHKETARLILQSDQLIADTIDGNEEKQQ